MMWGGNGHTIQDEGWCVRPTRMRSVGEILVPTPNWRLEWSVDQKMKEVSVY